MDIDDLLENLRAKILRDNMPEPLFNVVRLAGNVRLKTKQKNVVITKIHKDIVSDHIHRSGKNWWIIDWGSLGRGLTCVEVFRAYCWTSVSKGENHQFWAWLRGDVPKEQLPIKLRSEIDMYLDWYSTWQNNTMDPEWLRCQLLIALLETYREVITLFNLRARISRAENLKELPKWARNLIPQLRALRAVG